MNFKKLSRGHRLLPVPPEMIVVSSRLEWPLFDANGSLIADRGAILPTEKDHEFLFKYFEPRMAVTESSSEVAAEATRADELEEVVAEGDKTTRLATLSEFRVVTGTRLRLRLPPGMSGGATFAGSRVIGALPNQALFITQPMVSGKPARFVPGERIELLGFSGQSIYEFECTVETVCRVPFDYLVLSSPANIRQVKLRRSVRVSTRIAAWLSVSTHFLAKLEMLGVVRDLSVNGMSLGARRNIARAGDRVQLRFNLPTDAADLQLDISALVRNATDPAPGSDLCTYGIEFDQLEPVDRLSLQCYVYEHKETEA